MPMINRTFRVDYEVHARFKMWCAGKGVDMSETIERFMDAVSKDMNLPESKEVKEKELKDN